MTALIAISLIIILGAALASATETALFSCSLVRARQLAESKNTRASRALLAVRENMSRPIVTVVVINNVFNIVGSLLVGAIAAGIMDNISIGIFSAVFTFLIIILGEIIPKTLGERFAAPVALYAAPAVLIMTKLLSPLIWAVERLTSPFNLVNAETLTTENEIRTLVQIGQEEGIVEPHEGEMIHRIFRLNDLTAQEIMTPRVSITSLPADAKLSETRDEIISSQHSRIVLTGESLDDIAGIALKDQLLAGLVEGRGEEALRSFARPAQFVPVMVEADLLLSRFKENRDHIAVVVDEFGGTAGVVTLEDVLEVLTGEIVDETDRVMDMQAAARRKRLRTLLLKERRTKGISAKRR